jgi:hypothetical protein
MKSFIACNRREDQSDLNNDELWNLNVPHRYHQVAIMESLEYCLSLDHFQQKFQPREIQPHDGAYYRSHARGFPRLEDPDPF